MSAWMTSENHVNVLATYAAREGLTIDPASVATLLTLHNVLSLLARYGNDYRDLCEGWKDYSYKPVIPDAPDLATYLLKQAHCFDYQACEHDGWQGSEGQQLVSLIAERCKAQGAVEDGPAYDACPWGVD